MLGLIVAAAGIFLSQITANPSYDGMASIIIGLILAATAGDVEKSIAGLDKEIKQAAPKIKRIFVEAEDRRKNS